MIALNFEAGRLVRPMEKADNPIWQPVGPSANDVRSFIKLTLNPVDSREIFAILREGLVYKTTDSAETWMQIASFNSRLSDVAFDPADPNIIYVLGTFGVFKSVDHGLNWEEHLFGQGLTSEGEIEISPVDRKVIFVSGSYKKNPRQGGAAVFKSTDGCATWSSMPLVGSYSGDCYHMAVAPSDPNVIYAACWMYVDLGGAVYFYFYKSFDGGKTWSHVHQRFIGQAIRSITINPTDPLKVHVSVSDGIYRTSDGGQTWDKNEGEPFTADLVFDPSLPNIVYASGSGGAIYKSTDGGINWTKSLIPGIQDAPSGVLLVSSSAVYFVSASGLFKSEDRGTSWTEKSDPQVQFVSVNSMAVSPSSPAVLYASVEKVGLFISHDAAKNWILLPPAGSFDSETAGLWINPFDAHDVWLLKNRPNSSDNFYRSSDGGMTWTLVEGVATLMSEKRNMAISERSPNHLCLVGSLWKNFEGWKMAFAKSADGGKTWSRSDIAAGQGSSCAVAFDAFQDDVIYAGGTMVAPSGETGVLYVSPDGGTNWTRIDGGTFGAENVQAVAADRFLNSRLFVGTSGGFYRSEDFGQTWAKTATFPVAAIKTNPLYSGDVYAAGGNGVYTSIDQGGTWKILIAGLPVIQVGALDLDVLSQTLYAGTNGGGIYGLTLPRIFSPLNVSGIKRLNRSLFLKEYVNVLSWNQNSSNQDVVSYRIYLMAGEKRERMLAQVDATTLEFRHRNVAAEMTYGYVLVAVSSEGREGESAAVTVK